MASLPRELVGFDHVISNPPYLESGRSDPSPDPGRRRSHVEGEGLSTWILAALAAAAPRGRVSFIQRSDRLGDLMSLLTGRAGGIVVAPLWPKAGRDAKRVVVQARVGSRAPLRVHPGLVLHEADGSYTRAADDLLRGGAWDLDG